MAARNLELKVPFSATESDFRVLTDLGARRSALLRQIDTYFLAPLGRLKLREVDETPAEGQRRSYAELISYVRAEQSGVRGSDYIVSPVADPMSLKAALAAALSVVQVVEKKRDLWLWENVRIHLDAVRGLGDFLEFEAVIGPLDSESESRARLETLIDALAIDRQATLAGSYCDLLKPASGPG